LTAFTGWVQGLDLPLFWTLLALVTALALAAAYGLFRILHRVRIIEDTPTSRVRSAAQGFVELSGHGQLLPGEPIRAPLTGIRCTWWEYKVEQRVERMDLRGNRSTSWQTIRSATSDELFLLRDETGECVIDPAGATVHGADSDTWYGDIAAWSGPPQRATQGNRDYRFTEQRMYPDDPLYALGHFTTVGGAEGLADRQTELRELLAAWKRDPQQLARFDRDADGQISPQEWEQVRAAAKAQLTAERAERMAAPPTHLLQRPTDGRHPYILSRLPEPALTRRLRRHTGLALLLLLLLAGGGLLLYAARFG